jgi:hypothetical protein
MRFVTFMCLLLSVIFILHSIPDDVYFLNFAIYTLLFAILLQLTDINRKMGGE